MVFYLNVKNFLVWLFETENWPDNKPFLEYETLIDRLHVFKREIEVPAFHLSMAHLPWNHQFIVPVASLMKLFNGFAVFLYELIERVFI
jgi:hypothetical protein